MTPLILLFGGMLLMWIGMTDTVLDVLGKAEKSPITPGYPSVPFLPYAVAAVLVTMPLIVVKDNKEWAGKYIFLILLAVAVYNYDGIKHFTDDLNSLYKSN